MDTLCSPLLLFNARQALLTIVIMVNKRPYQIYMLNTLFTLEEDKDPLRYIDVIHMKLKNYYEFLIGYRHSWCGIVRFVLVVAT